VQRLAAALKLLDVDLEAPLLLLERVHVLKVAGDEVVKERAGVAVDLGGDPAELALEYRVEAVLGYLFGVIVVLPRARRAGYDLGLAVVPFLCLVDAAVELAAVELVVRRLLAAVREGHRDGPHAEGVHLVCPDDLRLRPDKPAHVVGVRDDDVLARIAVPEEAGLELAQAVRRIVGHAVRVRYRVADKVKEYARRDLVAQKLVPDALGVPVRVEGRRAAKKGSKRYVAVRRH